MFLDQLFLELCRTRVLVPVLQPDGTQLWQLSDHTPVNLKLPESITAVLDQRLKLLSDKLLNLLQYAAIIGEEFPAQLLQQLNGMSEKSILKSLNILSCDFLFIEPKKTVNTEPQEYDNYYFMHSFYREYIYNKIEDGLKRIMHREVGEALEDVYTDPYLVAGQIAQHFSIGKQPLKAIRYASAAARSSIAHFTWDESEYWCQFGLREVEKAPANPECNKENTNLLMLFAYTAYRRADYKKAEQRYLQALTIANEKKVDNGLIASIYIELANTTHEEGDFQKMINFISRADLVLREMPFSEEHIDLRVLQTIIPIEKNPHQAIELLREALEQSQKLPDTPNLNRIRADIYNELGILLVRLGHLRKANSFYRKSVHLSKELGNLPFECTARLNIADNLINLGEFNIVQSEISTIREIGKKLGDTDINCYSLYLEGEMLLQQNQDAKAIKILDDAIKTSQNINANWNMATMLTAYSIALFRAQELETAKHNARLAVKFGNSSTFERGRALTALSRIEESLGNWSEAQRYFTEAIDLLSKAEFNHLTALARRHYGEALIRHNQVKEGQRLLSQAKETFIKEECNFEIKHIDEFLSKNV